MTEIPSKGLLPQLTDVLHALADSHELLLSTLRSLRLENEALLHWADEHETPHAEFLDVVDRRSSVVVESLTAPASNAHEAVHLPEVNSADLMHANRPAFVDTAAASALPVFDEVRLDEFETMHPPAPLRPDAAHVVNGEPVDAESSNRNYNYFDELDARLAHLGRADPDLLNPEPAGLLSAHNRS